MPILFGRLGLSSTSELVHATEPAADRVPTGEGLVHQPPQATYDRVPDYGLFSLQILPTVRRPCIATPSTSAFLLHAFTSILAR